jgi:hypothetical protein
MAGSWPGHDDSKALIVNPAKVGTAITGLDPVISD